MMERWWPVLEGNEKIKKTEADKEPLGVINIHNREHGSNVPMNTIS